MSAKDYGTANMLLSERITAPRGTPRGGWQHDTEGFSLLELVVAVSIMLILGSVGFVSYQNYTDNARKAAVENASQQVLTAVIAADDSPGDDPLDALISYNKSTDDHRANITTASTEELVITTVDRDGTLGTVSISGNYEHLPVTQFSDPGVTYRWTGEPHYSTSEKLIDGEVVATNLVQNPSFERPNDYLLGASRIEHTSEWSKSGEHSLKHWSRYTTSRGSGYIDIATSQTPRGLEAGKTYTMYAEIRKDHDAHDGRLFTEYIHADDSNKASSPHEAGEYRLRVVFTIPEEGQGLRETWWVRLYHYGMLGDPPVFWDNLMILEGDVEMEYFDGDSH